MLGYLCTVLLLAGYLAVAFPVMASPSQADSSTQKLTEVEQLKLQLATEKQRRIEAEFKAAMSLCQAQPSTRAILNSSDSVDAELQKLLTGFFDAHQLNPDQYKIDPTTYEFKKVP